ncbi:MAG: L,D-transpeptidase [Gammaproteobacteria bacterium]|nr:L,D-transpeptidase [Gammaproteobacteria bacterium]
MIFLELDIATQQLSLYQANTFSKMLLKQYLVSTAKNGVGELHGSEKTPSGLHVIRAKIGENQPINAVFVERRPTGEIYSPMLQQQFPQRDWILTRILWLSGLERGKNRLNEVDTMRRFIYIHGTPDDVTMGIPGSRGCIRMRNRDIIELYDLVSCGARIDIG